MPPIFFYLGALQAIKLSKNMLVHRDAFFPATGAITKSIGLHLYGYGASLSLGNMLYREG